ncbi:MAG: 50S ribosomal protein L3 [Phycisphaerae bacterium]|nr:50S ribosomal protein L3 [Phycisphaerae bacterium]
MALTMLGTKLGMTRVYTDGGLSVPVTAIQLGPCVVTQVRTVEKDGYSAVQIAFGEMKARNATQAVIAHDANAGSAPKRFHREFRCEPAEAGKFQVGQVLTVKDFDGTKFVDVTGTSKGKGFQGTMKRHHFKGMFASHGTERKHRSPGSIGSLCSNRGYGGGLKKGKRMAGHMGADRVTCRSLDVVRLDPEAGLMLVKGAVPGAARGMVMVRTATRLYKSKAKIAAAK